MVARPGASTATQVPSRPRTQTLPQRPATVPPGPPPASSSAATSSQGSSSGRNSGKTTIAARTQKLQAAGAGSARVPRASTAVKTDFRAIRIQGMPLTLKFMVTIAGMVGLLMLMFFLIVYIIVDKALDEELNASGVAITKSLVVVGQPYIDNIYNKNFLESLLSDESAQLQLRGQDANGNLVNDGAIYPQLTERLRTETSTPTWARHRKLTHFERDLIVAARQYYMDTSGILHDFNLTGNETWPEAWARYLKEHRDDPDVQSVGRFIDSAKAQFITALREVYHDRFEGDYVSRLVDGDSGSGGRITSLIVRREEQPQPGNDVAHNAAVMETLRSPASDVDIANAWGTQRNDEVYVNTSAYVQVDGTERHVRQFMLLFRARAPSWHDPESQDRGTWNEESYIACVQLDAAAIEDGRSKLTLLLVAVAFLAVIIGVCVSYFLSHGITKPINSLVEDVIVIARGDYGHRTRLKPRDEIGVLARTIDAMCEHLQEGLETRKQLAGYKNELNVTEDVIVHLLPDSLPKIYGYDVYAFYNPSKEIGGDYYDFYPIDPNNIGMIVADVSGKGIPGAMVMTMARTVLRYEAVKTTSPREAFIEANRHIARDIKRGMFVTAFYLVLNTQTAEMFVASAGHNPMYLWRASTGKCESINPNGIALGFDKGPIFERTIKEEKVKLYSGDRVLMYTDGISEAMNPEQEEFGEERLIELIEAYPTATSNQLTNIIVQAVQEHAGPTGEQHDDITIVTFKLN